MTEQIINSILLALHNIALVGCAAAPFYNRNLVNTRAQYGPKLFYKLDKVVEDTLQGNVPYCIVFIIVLFMTGIGMPLNYYLFHGAFKQLSVVVIVAVVLKLLFVFGMMVIMGIIFLNINPKLRDLFAKFSPDSSVDADIEKSFFILRARRKKLCETCLYYAIFVLIFSAFLRFEI